MLEAAWLDPAWCVSTGPCLPSHSLQQSSRGRRRDALGAAGKEDAASCHWETAENVAAALELGEDKGKVGGAAFALSYPPALGSPEGSCGKECCARGHRASWELDSGAIQDVLQNWHRCVGVWPCVPQLTADHQPWALSVCPGQLLAP